MEINLQSGVPFFAAKKERDAWRRLYGNELVLHNSEDTGKTHFHIKVIPLKIVLQYQTWRN